MNLKKEFFNYLENDDIYFEITKNEKTYNFVKIPYNSTIDLIYMAYNYHHSIVPSNKLENCGFYDKKHKKLYNIDYQVRSNILDLEYGDNPYPSKEQINDKLDDKVSNYITDYVLNNKKEFYDSAKGYDSDIEDRNVRKYFIDDIKELTYKANYISDNEMDVLEYITKGEDFVSEKAVEYFNKNKEQIGKELYDIDKKNELLTNIWNDKEDSLHKVKEIVKSVKDGDYGNVHVFIHKNGLNFNFKYDASVLEREWDWSHLSTYNMPAPDRRNFANLFGRNEDFAYKDITKIEYRNNPIYIDKNFKVENENVNSNEEEFVL